MNPTSVAGPVQADAPAVLALVGWHPGTGWPGRPLVAGTVEPGGRVRPIPPTHNRRTGLPDKFLLPALYDIGGRDCRALMDVAVFRLSKRDMRADVGC
jgi:hypothetical protein